MISKCIPIKYKFIYIYNIYTNQGYLKRGKEGLLMVQKNVINPIMNN